MKLLRKDVVKWLKNLRSGAYAKGEGQLVYNDGTRFCCLGVWADQHGATWLETEYHELIPIPKGGSRPAKGQSTSTLKDKRLAYGLTLATQNDLVELNDCNSGWSEVINYIEKELLPKAV